MGPGCMGAAREVSQAAVTGIAGKATCLSARRGTPHSMAVGARTGCSHRSHALLLQAQGWRCFIQKLHLARGTVPDLHHLVGVQVSMNWGSGECT